MATGFDVQDWVYSLRTLPILRFYPTAAAKATSIPLAQVWKELNKLVHVGWLTLLYEVRCPNCATTVRLVATNDPTSLYDDTACTLCGCDFEVTWECIFPTFQINDEWRVSGKKDLAVAGQITSTGGGAVSLAVMGSAQISLTDLLPPDEAAVLHKLLADMAKEQDDAPEIKMLSNDLTRIPKNRAEKTALIDRLRTIARDSDTFWRFGKTWWPLLVTGLQFVLKLFGVDIPVVLLPTNTSGQSSNVSDK